MKFLEQFAHRDAHFAHTKSSVIQHIRMANRQDGLLRTMCGHMSDDWVRDDFVEDVYCQSCMLDMADFLVEELRMAPPKLELVDWTKERRILMMSTHECRN